MVNVVLDYILIFGKFGLPEMGIKGAALASVISEIVALLYFMYYMKVKTDIRKYRLLEDFNFNLKKQARILKIAGPIMLQNFMALSTWLSFFMIIEQIGEQELAISHIIRSIYMVVMIPLFGFSSAASTLVSNLMGEKRVNEVTLLIRRIVALSVSTTAIFIPFLLLFPRQIISVYTTNLTLITGSMDLLPIICGAMLFFSIAFIVFSSVTGTGKTLVTLGIEFTSISIYLTVAYLLAIKYNKPLTIVWSTEFIYFGIMGLLAILYLKWGKWKNSTI
jgi:putative MATE family efflux protein